MGWTIIRRHFIVCLPIMIWPFCRQYLTVIQISSHHQQTPSTVSWVLTTVTATQWGVQYKFAINFIKNAYIDLDNIISDTNMVGYNWQSIQITSVMTRTVFHYLDTNTVQSIITQYRYSTDSIVSILVPRLDQVCTQHGLLHASLEIHTHDICWHISRSTLVQTMACWLGLVF